MAADPSPRGSHRPERVPGSADTRKSDADAPAPEDPKAQEAPAVPSRRPPIGKGPGTLLVTLYGIFTVGAASRSIVQLTTRFGEAPLAYLLSAVAALVYAFITLSLVRGGERARRAAFGCCCVELLGVLAVGTWTLVEPSAFPDATVWSDYGMGYLFIPVILPVTGLVWLRRSRAGSA
ncbi:hypothetical protein H180DRAFT_03785 [Streptomyces sp. WMMB 322]|nr:hypothetical protein [Streptomyces sp. WMMB 322]SCK43393.1 hypothetical protein H180DRAFT_03785 [Streptomyces sp. WMMB 322]